MADHTTEFVNDAVLAAKNPSEYGYHGPIPPGEEVLIASIHTHICDVVVDGGDRMCGKTFKQPGGLYRHIREYHPSLSASVPGRANVKMGAKIAGENAIRRWVLKGGWRRARYVYEPKNLPPTSLIYRFADELEALARRNAAFRHAFGSSFHRSPVVRRRLPRSLPEADGESSAEVVDSTQTEE